MRREIELAYEFVEFIPNKLKERISLHFYDVWNCCTQMLLRVREGNCDATLANRMATDFRRQVDFTLPVDWELELVVSVPLLYNEEQSGVGTAMVQRTNCQRTGTGSHGQRKVLRARQQPGCPRSDNVRIPQADGKPLAEDYEVVFMIDPDETDLRST